MLKRSGLIFILRGLLEIIAMIIYMVDFEMFLAVSKGVIYSNKPKVRSPTYMNLRSIYARQFE